MKPTTRFLALMLLLVLFMHPPATGAAQGGWQAVGPGIDYQAFQLPTPNNVFVARMERQNQNLTLESGIGQGRLNGGTERVSDMFARYDGAINYWGQEWGGRNQVVVAINGSFFDFGTGVPEGGLIHSGWYAKRFPDRGGGSGFAWRLDRTAFIGGCVFHKPDAQIVTHVPSGVTVEINGVNKRRLANELILYTPQFDATTGTNGNTFDGSMEVLVELERPSLIVPAPSPGAPPRYVVGTVRDIRLDQGSTPIPFDHVVLSARGAAKDQLLGAGLQIGDQIGINQEITDDDDCDPPYTSDNSWTKTYASIGGYPVLLRDSDGDGVGEIPDFEAEGVSKWDVREPRTAIAFNDQYVFFIVVDGRNPGVSEGMTYPELAQFARDTLGAAWAINQDGGGSSTMVVNGRVMNNTYCNHFDCSQNPNRGVNPHRPPPPYRSPGEHNIYLPIAQTRNAIQRLVANSMMMVVVLPKDLSLALSPGESVTTLEPAALRLGPGDNYTALATIPANSQGVVLPHDGGLNGVQAKGLYWWKVDFNGTQGWISEDALIAFNWLDESRFQSLRDFSLLFQRTR